MTRRDFAVGCGMPSIEPSHALADDLRQVSPMS